MLKQFRKMLLVAFLVSNVKKYIGDCVCPICGTCVADFSNLRSIEVMVRLHREQQFPITLTDPKTGFSLAELPSCLNTEEFFKPTEKSKKIKLFVLDNEA